MANLFFPQLMSGALAQYPIQKTRLVRTVRNVLPDGNMILYADATAGHIVWDLQYTELSSVDAGALQAHFQNCAGPLRAFTFIDPTENMLCWSSDLSQSVWSPPATLQLEGGISDPFAGQAAFSLSNNSQIPQGIQQTLAVPSGYQYVFSTYITSASATNVTVVRSGAAQTVTEVLPVSQTWSRIASSGQLADAGQSFTISLLIGPGQQVSVFGPQLEAQIAPSRYRPTFQIGGVHSSAHWGVDQLPLVATAPGQFSTAFTIETAL